MLQQPELLAPAGSLETLKYAVLYGADAVYCALPEFGMRAAPVNLTVEELQQGCIYAHARGKKVYLTLNTLPTNEELKKLPQYIQEAAAAGVDELYYMHPLLVQRLLAPEPRGGFPQHAAYAPEGVHDQREP